MKAHHAVFVPSGVQFHAVCFSLHRYFHHGSHPPAFPLG